MNEKKAAEFIEEAVECLQEQDNFDGPYTGTIQTLEGVGLKSKHKGLVIPFEDGSEFRIIIVQAK